jgi:hypothetical protein
MGLLLRFFIFTFASTTMELYDITSQICCIFILESINVNYLSSSSLWRVDISQQDNASDRDFVYGHFLPNLFSFVARDACKQHI